MPALNGGAQIPRGAPLKTIVKAACRCGLCCRGEDPPASVDVSCAEQPHAQPQHSICRGIWQNAQRLNSACPADPGRCCCSISDDSVPPGLRGKYGAFSLQGSRGGRHLRELAAAGLTHVHLLPLYDFATVPERPQDQRTVDQVKYKP
jgi:hypothetical protein